MKIYNIDDLNGEAYENALISTWNVLRKAYKKCGIDYHIKHSAELQNIARELCIKFDDAGDIINEYDLH